MFFSEIGSKDYLERKGDGAEEGAIGTIITLVSLATTFYLSSLMGSGLQEDRALVCLIHSLHQKCLAQDQCSNIVLHFSLTLLRVKKSFSD